MAPQPWFAHRGRDTPRTQGWQRDGQTGAVNVTVAYISLGDGPEFIEAARAGRRLHRPLIDPPDTAERFAAYLEHTAREDQEAFVVRHASCGNLVGWVSVSNIVRRAFQSAHLGYLGMALLRASDPGGDPPEEDRESYFALALDLMWPGMTTNG